MNDKVDYIEFTLIYLAIVAGFAFLSMTKGWFSSFALAMAIIIGVAVPLLAILRR